MCLTWRNSGLKKIQLGWFTTKLEFQIRCPLRNSCVIRKVRVPSFLSICILLLELLTSTHCNTVFIRNVESPSHMITRPCIFYESCRNLVPLRPFSLSQIQYLLAGRQKLLEKGGTHTDTASVLLHSKKPGWKQSENFLHETSYSCFMTTGRYTHARKRKSKRDRK